jgi:hypothetical protein
VDGRLTQLIVEQFEQSADLGLREPSHSEAVASQPGRWRQSVEQGIQIGICRMTPSKPQLWFPVSPSKSRKHYFNSNTRSKIIALCLGQNF